MPELVPVGMARRWAIGIAAWLIALSSGLAPAAAQPVVVPMIQPLTQPPPGHDLPPATIDGRMLGHLPYAEVARGDLVAAPPWFAIGPLCLLHRDAAPDLTRLLAAAAIAPGVGKALRGVSCFRTIAHQRAVFCRGARAGLCGNPVRRARFVGPPGYSEHATGYAIDFGIRPAAGCADVDACIATTATGRWLIGHAADYGFELSFPAGNAQGVTWEPWHWRWVGASVDMPGAARARLVFARARLAYPASPGVSTGAPVTRRAGPSVWPWARPPAPVPAPVPLPIPAPAATPARADPFRR